MTLEWHHLTMKFFQSKQPLSQMSVCIALFFMLFLTYAYCRQNGGPNQNWPELRKLWVTDPFADTVQLRPIHSKELALV